MAKRRLFSSFLISFFLIFTLLVTLSCSMFLSDSSSSSISFTFSDDFVHNVRNGSRTISASELENLYIEISLLGSYTASKTATLSAGTTITFSEIPVGSKIKAKAEVYEFEDGEKLLSFMGESEEITVAAGENTLTLKMKEVVVASITSDGTTTDYTSFYEAITNWTSGSTLTLFVDIKINETLAAQTGENGTTNITGIVVKASKILDLNGHTITLAPASHKSQERVISVHNANTVLTLKDSSGINAGKLTGVNPSSDNGWSGALYINMGASVSMYGGTITGNTATNGAGVWIDGRTKSSNNGGTFNMYGGVIANNTGTKGAGVYVGCQLNESAGTAHFNMYGGTITNNTATDAGSNVYVDHGIMTMIGGTIINSTATNPAGISASSSGTLTIKGESRTGDITDDIIIP